MPHRDPEHEIHRTTMETLFDSVEKKLPAVNEQQKKEQLVSMALRELEGTRCACGNHKRSMNSFCHYCYYALPKQMRSDLYKHIKDGYAEAYQAAKDWLRENKKRGAEPPEDYR